MCDSIFALGQRGGYYFESPSGRYHSSLPKQLNSILTKKQAAEVYHVTIGAGSSFMISYKEREGSYRIESDALPNPLNQFIHEKDAQTRYLRDLKNISICMGSYNESWFASDGKSWLWMNLPSGLESALRARMRDGNWTDRPRIVTLGVGNDFLMITESNTVVWSLGSYRTLSKWIQLAKNQNDGIASIRSVILHPYRFESFIAQSADGAVISENLPLHMQNDFTATKEAIKSDTAQGRLARHRVTRPGPSRQATLRREWSNQANGIREELEREYKMKLKLTLNISAGSISRIFGGR
ncbi:hypothetical protein AOQ84DRAFT_397482 [Glonium stellatum]|uniref:Uncharacterized protein n=1 Tax=Glonium stellatum TaxID=574774 RepID=A0A8E2F2V6_9PEZI|nr:hypothetical protein AOQ84DRAFT_397482 [Glonium stellatum]